MEKGTLVKDIIAGSCIWGIFVIRSANLGKARNGAPYWALELGDASGSIEARIWSPLCEEYPEMAAGTFVSIGANAGMFRDRCQLVVENIAILDAKTIAELELAQFFPASPYDRQQMFSELVSLYQGEMTYGPWRRLLDDIFYDPEIKEAFMTRPAARTVHQAYVGGLLEHTLNVARLCMRIADQYGELDRQTLLAGAILHDIGKIRELGGVLQPDYTQSGKLLGHIFLGVEIADAFLQKSDLDPHLREHLFHLILSHHGKHEYGAPQLPQTAEAFVLHYADNLDAKLAQCRSFFPDNAIRPFWSAWQPILGRAMLLPQTTPSEPRSSQTPLASDSARLPGQMNENADCDFQNADIPLPDDALQDSENNGAGLPSAWELEILYADPDFNRIEPDYRVKDGKRAKNNGNRNNIQETSQCSLL